MKSNFLLKKQALTILLSLSTIFVFSQPQQHVWQFQNQEIDFTSGAPQVNSTSNQTFSYENSHGIHDDNGNMILKIVDGTVYNKFNQVIGGLTGYSSGMVNSLQIIPFKNNQCKYYVVYSAVNLGMPCCFNGDEPCCFAENFLYYSIVDLSLDNGNGVIVSNGNILNTSNSSIKYEDFATSTLSNNGDRYLYNIG